MSQLTERDIDRGARRAQRPSRVPRAARPGTPKDEPPVPPRPSRGSTAAPPRNSRGAEPPPRARAKATPRTGSAPRGGTAARRGPAAATRAGVKTPARTAVKAPARGVSGATAPTRGRRPAVRIVPRRAGNGRPRPPRTPFVLLVAGLLCGGLVSLLLLNAVLARDSFTAAELREQNKEISLRKEQALLENAKREGPAEVAQRAEDQGMRPDWDSIDPITPDEGAQIGAAVQGGAEDVDR